MEKKEYSLDERLMYAKQISKEIKDKNFDVAAYLVETAPEGFEKTPFYASMAIGLTRDLYSGSDIPPELSTLVQQVIDVYKQKAGDCFKK